MLERTSDVPVHEGDMKTALQLLAEEGFIGYNQRSKTVTVRGT